MAGYTRNGTDFDLALARYFGGDDDVAPRVTIPTQTLQSTTLGLSAVPVRISWSATDAQGDVTRYELQRSTDGGGFTGTNVAWVAPKGPTMGRAEVYLDGRRVATVDLYSSGALSRRVVYAANGLSAGGTHTLQIKVLGTANRSRVDVDAFVVLR